MAPESLAEIQTKLQRHKVELRERFNVVRIGVFGSYARGEHSDDSDVDVLVDFSETIGLFGLVDLKGYLEDLLGTEVDIATEKALKPFIKDEILAEVVYV